ncbi:hypothetical protein NLG97_g3202 [Lecanicillium saksenae]|uniref:Uncharacterized protein n=1 Tax=Lecanicillium saksenae TaxID=468837 RepID=A0ACC1R257_9HYPO|nr:hypothetical protein NLG97_g3202 [Lecanicillium saksenae]
MASSSTALSKTAINTLRGVLFTTSFSVVLLAEERRRRIKIARAAVDNARKIHAAKASRNAEGCATAEPFDLEARLASLEVIAHSGAPASPHRRERRKAVATSKTLGSSIPASASTTSEPSQPPSNTPPDNIALARIAEIMLASRRSGDAPSKRTGPQPNTPPDIIFGDEIAETAALAKRSSKTAAITHAVAVPKIEMENAVASSSDALEYEYIMVTPEDREAAPASYNDALAALIRAVQDLSKSPVGTESLQAFQMALAALQNVGKHKRTQFSHRAIVQDIVVDLLKYSVNMTASEMTDVLKAAQFLRKSLITVLNRFLDWIEEYRPSDVVQALQNILRFFEAPEQLSWLGGHVAAKLVKARRSRSNQLAIKQYEILKKAGLFTNNTSQQHEYHIRREVIIAACAAGQTHVVEEEMAALRQLRVKDTDTDFKLQAALMIQQVVLGTRDTVLESLRDLERLAGSSTEFQKHLGQLTNLFAKMYDTDGLCRWLKGAVETYGMVLRTEWVFAVLNGHAYHHDIPGMMAWLEYCLGHGLRMDYDFAIALKQTCRKHLRFGQEDVQKLWTKMAKFILPTHMGYYGAQYKCDKSGLKDRMAELTEGRHWDKACRVFNASLSKSRDVCDASLQLALDACVRANRGNAEPALRMLEKARAFGKDTAAAQREFLCAEIKTRPSEEIKSLLYMTANCGSEIPAEVYRLATEKVMNTDLRAAHEILLLGVDQLGHGKLAFNGYSFGKLLHINIALRRYDTVHALLSEFVSTREFWHGSRLCKESIKFAMRELVKRSDAEMVDEHVDDKTEHSVLGTELRLMDELQQALEHNMESRLDSGYHAVTAEMIIQLVEEVAQRKDVAAALEWQRNKKAAKAARKAAKGPAEGSGPRRDRITHISVDV